LRAARLAKGYSLEDLAIATGLTVAEIAAAEDSESGAPRHHVERISHALT
jgi:transcriptional regulator with XRE-family HTH domain